MRTKEERRRDEKWTDREEGKGLEHRVRRQRSERQKRKRRTEEEQRGGFAFLKQRSTGVDPLFESLALRLTGSISFI